MFRNFIKKYNFFKVNQDLIEANGEKERLSLENLLIIILYTPYFILGFILHLYVSTILDLNPFFSNCLSAYLFLNVILFLFLGSQKNYEKIIAHAINISLSVCMIVVYLTYRNYFLLAFWLIPIIIIMPTILNFQFLTYYYSVFTVALLFLFDIVAYFDEFVDFGFIENLVFVIIYALAIIKIYFLKLLQQQTVRHLQKQLDEITAQKEEITVMYEEVVATEDELRQNNIKLLDYAKEIEQKNSDVAFYANYDSLTRLPNRNLMMKTLIEFIEDPKNSAFDTLIFANFDLNDFKIVNDSLGHDIGDSVLKVIAENLKNNINSDDILFRTGGDEFSLIILRPLNREEIEEYVKEILEVFKKKVKVDSYEVTCHASVGISIYPDDSITLEGIIGAADTAMYRAKKNKLKPIVFFEQKMKEQIVKRAEREKMLGKALENEQLFVEFQPLVSTEDAKIVGFEALVRWTLPGQGVVPPFEFIDIAEKNGMISEITKFVLKQSCLAIKNLKKIYPDDFYISINLSPVQFINKDVVNQLRGVVEKYSISPKNIVLEITESAYINNKTMASEIISAFRNLGFKIAIDDFGTGYSSIEQLIRVHCDIVKIDRAFVNIINEDSGYNPAILDSIIKLAETLNMKVIAEGVETELHIDYLRKIKCDIFQGYYYSKPLPLRTIIAEIPQNKFMD